MRFDAKAGDKNTTPGDIDITVTSRHREKLYHCVAIRLATKTSLKKKKLMRVLCLFLLAALVFISCSKPVKFDVAMHLPLGNETGS